MVRQRLSWSTRGALVALFALALAACGGAGDESTEENTESRTEAVAAPRGPYTDWQIGYDNLWNIDIPMTVGWEPGSVPYFFSTEFFFGGPHGYFGLQPDGPLEATETQRGKVAMVSVWGASTGWVGGTGSFCQPFDEFGTGYRCVLPYAWTAGTSYRLRIWQVAAEDWVAAIADGTTGVETVVGTLRVPGSGNGLKGNLVSWTEWYGPQMGCSTYPYSNVSFGRPTGNAGAYTATSSGSWLGPPTGCDTTFLTDGKRGAVQEISTRHAWSLHRFFNPNGTDHYYTRFDGGYGPWKHEGKEDVVFDGQLPGTVPLYQLWDDPNSDHFYTTSWNEAVGAMSIGYEYVRVEGYVYSSPGFDRVPMYRYWNGGAPDHFYSGDWMADGAYGYGYEGVAWYTP